jgi:hypothetical protein
LEILAATRGLLMLGLLLLLNPEIIQVGDRKAALQRFHAEADVIGPFFGKDS